MPQNGIHAMVGLATRKWMPKKEWLLLGVVLGNMFPDLDNLVVAYATLAKLPNPEHFHRTFTHSIFTILAMLLLFYIVAAVTKNQKWNNFGMGFSIGILMHILLDLVLWFDGVALLWPLGGEVNLWAGFVMPEWFLILRNTGEYLMFGFYFLLLGSLSRKGGTDVGHQNSAKIWAYTEFGLFVVFAGVFFASGMKGLLFTIYGALYLLSIIVAMVVTVRMRSTVDSV